ncbi:MAG: helix-turn-helix transcriptional regulator [Clostridia bacterium]|nr:helix-turn-helix transcriptional regulator [Clostridia bacterium]
MNVNERIHQLRLARGWSVNNLAMESGMTQSTLNSILSRNTPPKIETLQSICNAFKITLAQFFMVDEQVELVNETEKELLMLFRRLPIRKQQALLEILAK